MSDDKPHLHLAAVDGEQTIPIDRADLVDELRMFADMVESGVVVVPRAFLICEIEGRVKAFCLGPASTILEAVGLLDIAKQKFLREAFGE